MAFSQIGSLDFCPNQRPLTPSPLLFMIGMGIWRIVRVLLWRYLTCQKPLIVFPTVPSCFSWELLGYLVPCTRRLRSYLSDRSHLVAVQGFTLHPVPVFSGIPQARALSWAHFFSSSTWMTYTFLTLLPIVHSSEIILSIYPYPLELLLSPKENCPVQVFVIFQDCCLFPSGVIIVCFILFCLVQFSLARSFLLFIHISDCPLLYLV